METTISQPGFTRMPYLFNVLVAVDQLGNAIADGNPDNTVSARVGYFASAARASTLKPFWKFLERVIDATFLPLQGPQHCYCAWLDEKDEMDIEGTSLSRLVLGSFVLIFCPLIWLAIQVLVTFFPPLRHTATTPRYDHWRRARLAQRQNLMRETVTLVPAPEKPARARPLFLLFSVFGAVALCVLPLIVVGQHGKARQR